MSKKPRETPETEAEKTTDASAVELQEDDLDEASGGAVFAKYDVLEADKYIDKTRADVLDAYVDKSTVDVVRTVTKPTSR